MVSQAASQSTDSFLTVLHLEGPSQCDQQIDSGIFRMKTTLRPTNHIPIPGWRLSHPSEKCEFVSWDDEIPNI